MGEIDGTLAKVPRERSWGRAVASLVTRRRLVVFGVPALFMAVTFSLYWYLGPQNTPAVNHVNQANAFIHGRLDIVPEYAKNVHLIEKACDKIENGACTEDAKLYVTHPPMPALILLPGVLLFGLAINATLVSVVMGTLTAPVVLAVVRNFTQKLTTQVWLTVLFLFGTIFWWTASNGGVWFFSHTVGVFFLFLAIWATLVRKNPLLTGVCLGAAYLSRQSMILGFPFFVLMFSDQWLLPAEENRSLWRRIDLKPLLELSAGVTAFVVASFMFNYLRFDNPLDSGYYHSEQMQQPQLAHVYPHGPFDPSYIQRHPPIALELLPVVQSNGPYVLPTYAGMAIWATTPAFFYALFANIRRRWVVALGALGLAVAVGVMISRAIADPWALGIAPFNLPVAWHLLPIYGMIALAIGSSFRRLDKLAIGCWLAIVLIALTNFAFAATGWTQFGYRYGMDFYPFLFLLTIKGIGDDIKWHHALLITLGVVISLWGVLWIYQFDPRLYNHWRWVTI